MVKWCSAGTCRNHHLMKNEDGSSKYGFFRFPSYDKEPERRALWAKACSRKDAVTQKPWAPKSDVKSVYICSAHFITGRPVKETNHPDYIPSKFTTTPVPTSMDDTSSEEADTMHEDHNYALAPDPSVVNLAHNENVALTEEILRLKKQIERITMKQRFGIHRFAGSDRDIEFFTRFASYDLLMRFWALIEPLLPSMVSVTQAQRGTFTEPISTATHSLQPIDEMFMFLNYLALGSKQRDLADRYGVHQTTVSQNIATWSNFLYTVLGSVRIWIPEENIRRHLPVEFRNYADTTVILDCMELRCQYPSSPLLQSEVFSAYKSHCTLKGLLGVAPHGAVTFISPLYAGSISDKQIMRESGILSILRPEMSIMVDRGFRVDDVVPCNIYRPVFLSGRSQMSACKVKETQAIARLRVHVERLIGRVKEHKFFDTEIPLRLFGDINHLYTVACLLTNYENGPLVKAKVFQ